MSFLQKPKGLKLTFSLTSQFVYKFFKSPAIHNFYYKKGEINQQLEALYTGCDKASVAKYFVSVLRVCDIDQKKQRKEKYIRIFWDCIDKDYKTIFFWLCWHFADTVDS